MKSALIHRFATCAAGQALQPFLRPWYSGAVALYHLHAQALSRRDGASAVAAAAYRSGERIVDERTGETHDYTRRSGVDHAEIIAPDQAAQWTRDREQLWNQAELAERRRDAQVAREISVALPAELAERERRALVRGFVREQFVSRGMVADVAYHHSQGKNPHAHVMLTMRRLDGERFAAKKEREWNGRDALQQWRSEWGRSTNRALERGGHDERVDHQTLRDQRRDALARGDTQAAERLDREPQVHLGKTLHMEERGQQTERGERYTDIAERNKQTTELPRDRERAADLQRQLNTIMRAEKDPERVIAEKIGERIGEKLKPDREGPALSR